MTRLADFVFVATQTVAAEPRVLFGTAAVTTVPVAAAVIVFIITETITFVLDLVTIPRTFFVFHNVWITAKALLAKGEAPHISIRYGATVATVPVTAAVVVFVITVEIALVFFETTSTLTALGLLDRVRALATLAKRIVVSAATTIAPVPVARTHVVQIIAIAVLLIARVFAFSLRRFGARGFDRSFLAFEGWV